MSKKKIIQVEEKVPKKLLFPLSLQHMFAMFGASVLVPFLFGINPAIVLFMNGVGTLLFILITKRKSPAYLGSSFAFIPLILSVKEAFNGDLAYAQGGIMVAGLIYVILSFVIKMVGVDKIKRYFPPQVTGAMIAVIGLNLLPTAFDMASNNIMIAMITLAIALIINNFGKGFIKQLGILIAVIIGYILSLVLGVVDIVVELKKVRK